MSPGRGEDRRDGLFAALSGEPGDGWRPRLLHHGSRAFLLVLAAVLVPVMFPRSPLPRFSHLEEGTVAEEDVIADVSFDVEKSPERLREERREAERSVTPVFELRSERADSSTRQLRGLFAALDSAAAAQGRDTTTLRAVLEAHGVEPTADQLSLLSSDTRRRQLREALLATLDELLPRGVVPTSQLLDVPGGRILVRDGERDRRVERDSVLTLGRYYAMAADRAPEELTAEGLQLFQTLVVALSEPTLELDRAATDAARQQARRAVETVAGHVLEGERIVAAHERVSSAEVEKLRAYREALRDRGMGDVEAGLLRDLGAVLYALVLLGLLAGAMLFFRTEVYRDMRGFVIVTASTILVLLAASAVSHTGTPSALVPVAVAALVVGTLYDGLLAVGLAAVVAGLLVGQPSYGGAAAPFLTLAAGAAAAFGVRGVRRRADAWILIAAIAGAYALGGLSLALMRTLPIGQAVAIAGWGAANATACTLLAVGLLLPMLEGFTGITTEQTLLELCDLNRPLLQRLSREAPGTYAHSINVANLTESATAAIGGHPLLARAGTYYHDIGKMARPQFFIENQPPGRNPHDRLPPRKSAEVIRAHVEEGLRMAREARLPTSVRAFIREHHGTMPIAYFLEKARCDCEPGEEPRDADFRYPGPKPQSIETAVLMLADGVESAVRTVSDPTAERIRETVDGIVRARLDSGQLDEAPVTLRDLDRVKEEFVRVLSGIYHHRIDYPEEASDPDPSEEVSGYRSRERQALNRRPSGSGRTAAATGGSPEEG